MSQPAVTLLMAIHCHQPVGNFGSVFEDAWARAYGPFLDVLERHPGVRVALHYSGSLLDWLVVHRPEFIRRVRRLAQRGQIELLAAGYYEPILPLIPEADRQGQLALMRSALRRHFGAEGQGLWLTERVWEPDLPGSLARAGIRYTMVDVNQFESARPWLPAGSQAQDEHFWDLLDSYATDYQGASVRLLPASKRLRYWLPFQPVDRTIEWLKRLQREAPVAVTFADDGEKFGLWPKTHQTVYTEGWLEQFFGALEREQAWLGTARFADYVAQTPPRGVVALPCGSYEEMLQWSHGHFRNFFTKYPEAQAMQQKMLRISERLQTALAGSAAARRGRPRTASVETARRELYQGQCNCAYWHGVFGGLYLGHLRRAVYRHLIAADDLLSRALGEPAGVAVGDPDGDGVAEVTLKTPQMRVVVDPEEGGTVTEWSLFGPGVNLVDTLTRRPEVYHEKLKQRHAQPVAASGAVSIHDLLGVKEAQLETRLFYDDHRRAAFLDFGFQSRPTVESIVRSTWGEQRLWGVGPYALAAGRPRRRDIALERTLLGGRIRKILQAGTNRLICRYRVEGIEVPVVALEFNLGLRDPRYRAEPGVQEAATSFDVRDPDVGVSVTLALDGPATLVHFPIETVSESEEGMERTYQGLAVVCLWAVGAAGRGAWERRLQWTVGRPAQARRGRS